MSKDFFYPFSVGPSGDIRIREGYEQNAYQSVLTIVENTPVSIPAFPEIGLPFELFGDKTEQVLNEDLLSYDLLLQEPRIIRTENVEIRMRGDGVLWVTFDYETRGGTKGHFSTEVYHVGGVR